MRRSDRFLPTLVLAFLSVAFCWVSSARAEIAPPEGPTEVIPWSALGARVAAQARGDELSISICENGARLHCAFQKIDGHVSPNGLWLVSTLGADGEDRFHVAALSVGRAGTSASACASPRLLAHTGRVEVASRMARFVRQGVVEEYSVSPDGLRQDFIVLERPAGTGALRIGLEVGGARVEAAPYGARLSLECSGREIAYSRLSVSDAEGRSLAARFEAGPSNGLAIVVEDDDATYPIRVDPTFSDADWVSMGTLAGANGSILTIAVSLGGTIYVGGTFLTIGDVPLARRVAKWDGSSWSALGGGMNSTVNALAVVGTDLYAGGAFDEAGGNPIARIAKWDGTAWSALGAGVAHTSFPVNYKVSALAVSGTDLYVGGFFNLAGGNPANSVAKWDGSAWSSLGLGVVAASPTIQTVLALVVSGTDVYAGGAFTTAGGSPASRVAKWDGSAWSPLGSGVNNIVFALAVSGADVYAGGFFTLAGGGAANGVAHWNGAAWSPLGGGVSPVNALAISGTDLIAGGSFTVAGGNPANFLAKWNGAAWSPVDGGVNNVVNALAVSGADLYVGGAFTTAGGGAARRIAKWDGAAFSALGSVANVGLDNGVLALAVIGTDLYVGGGFTMVGTSPLSFVAKWDGSAWSTLGAGVNGSVNALAVSGTDLYAGGNFTTAGGNPANRIAKWDGSAWSALGAGVNNTVNALAVSGTNLYVGGVFSAAGGNPANQVARWDGSAWSVLGSGVGGSPSFVFSLATSGSDLYVGGLFTTAGGNPASNIAKWDGSTWSPLGTGVGPNPPLGLGTVNALAVSGTDVYAGGVFTIAGGSPASKVAKWDGSGWSSLGTGITGAPFSNVVVQVLAVSGTDVYVGGSFDNAGGVPAANIAKWDGSTWSALGSGTTGGVSAIAFSGTDMYVGGSFGAAGNKISAYIAKAILGVGVGAIAGQAAADCPSANSPLLGVRVDIYEVGSGDLVASAVTDAGGSYLIEDLPAGDYVVTIVNPLGYTTASLEVPISVEGGGTATADFALHCQAITANPRSIGFWKHQVGVATGGKGAAEINAATLCSYLDLIAAHFNSNAINQVIVYVPPVSGTCADKLQVAKDLLNLTGSSAMIDRAQQQLMALLLNIAAGYISQTQVISSDGRVVSQAITYCDNLIDSPSGDYEQAKTISDLINNGQPVPAGTIPLSTQQIAYHLQPVGIVTPSLALEGVRPNPASGNGLSVAFTLPSGAAARLDLLDVNGRRVLAREVGSLGPGVHTLDLAEGRKVAPGIYWVRLTQGANQQSTRVAVVE